MRSASFVLAVCLLLSVSSVSGAKPESLPPFVDTTVAQDELLEVIASSQSWQFKPIGRTSVVFRMRTRAHVTAALKVRSRQSQRGYQYEIAAYRVARLLGLDNVPPAIYRRATRREIQARFHEEHVHRWSSVRRSTLWDDDGSVPGAAIYWIKRARSAGLAKHKDEWQPWLQGGGAVPSEKIPLARDLSTMVVFDFLIGNWDRYSGGNLLSNSTHSRAYLLDNDSSFSAPLNERVYERLLRELTNAERFSKDLVLRLIALDEASIRGELARDPSAETEPLLSDLQVAELLDRRNTILSYISALTEERGRDEVLFFP